MNHHQNLTTISNGEIVTNSTGTWCKTAVSQALSVKLDDVALSRDTIQRLPHEKTVAITQKATFMFNGPLLIHWDGKLLTNITVSKEVVDRIAVLVTG